MTRVTTRVDRSGEADQKSSATRTGRNEARRAFDTVVAWSPVQSVFTRYARGPAVLAHHGIVDPEGFAAQLDFLIERYRPIAPSDLVGALDGRGVLPPRAVLITFDDADPTHLERALPLLRKRGLSALAFVVAGVLDTDRPFWWHEAEALHARGGQASALPDVRTPSALVRRLKGLRNAERERALRELRATAAAPAPRAAQLGRDDLKTLAAGGIEIGNHSLTHPILSHCPPAEARREVTEAHDRLTAAVGQPPRFFAYPNGDSDPTAEESLQRLGYRAAFLFDHRRARWPPRAPFRISRLRVGSETSLDRFKIILSGLHPALHHLLGRP